MASDVREERDGAGRWPFGWSRCVGQLPAPVGATRLLLPAPPREESSEPAPAAGSAARAIRAALTAALLQIREHEPAARRFDAEGVHQMRAAVRRLRSDLRTFGPLLGPAWSDDLDDSLRGLARTLGAVRDLDVLRVRLERAAVDLPPGSLSPLLATMDRLRDEAREALALALGSGAHRDLLARVERAARSRRLDPSADGPARTLLPPLARDAWRVLRRAARRLRPGAPEADHHRVRILAKRARFAAEAVAPSLRKRSRRAARRFARRAARLQDVLGALQDAVMARDLIERVVVEHPGAPPFLEAASRLLECQRRTARKARRRFPAAWAKLDRKKLRRWLKRS